MRIEKRATIQLLYRFSIDLECGTLTVTFNNKSLKNLLERQTVEMGGIIRHDGDEYRTQVTFSFDSEKLLTMRGGYLFPFSVYLNEGETEELLNKLRSVYVSY